jgi:hypothetical protein
MAKRPHRLLKASEGIHTVVAAHVGDIAERDALGWDVAEIGKVACVNGREFWVFRRSSDGSSFEWFDMTAPASGGGGGGAATDSLLAYVIGIPTNTPGTAHTARAPYSTIIVNTPGGPGQHRLSGLALVPDNYPPGACVRIKNAGPNVLEIVTEVDIGMVEPSQRFYVEGYAQYQVRNVVVGDEVLAYWNPAVERWQILASRV